MVSTAIPGTHLDVGRTRGSDHAGPNHGSGGLGAKVVGSTELGTNMRETAAKRGMGMMGKGMTS